MGIFYMAYFVIKWTHLSLPRCGLHSTPRFTNEYKNGRGSAVSYPVSVPCVTVISEAWIHKLCQLL